ncbi:MAG: type VI secretion system tip protein VgrG, partial [bacterium]|nr:type VI secretion system tip protein VgrG [bacterium]
VKVQFHWDRLGERNERSSAWIRVMQQWAGTGWGAIWIPRIGMEVIVSFLGGDPDRPVITGCLYNGDNPVPYELPANKTVSGWKTNSSQGGDGYNELKFEDKKGSEQIYVHAEKDYDEVVDHCHTTHVKVDQTNTVDHDQTETVGHDQKLTVKNDRTKTVNANELVKVIGQRKETVVGEEIIELKKNRDSTIDKCDRLKIKENHEITVDGKQEQRIGGGREIVIQADDTTRIKKNRITHVGGEYKIKSDHKYQLVEADTEKFILDGHGWWESAKNIKALVGTNKLEIDSSGKIHLHADTEIKLEVGNSSITLSPSGIEISGPSVKVNGSGGNVEIDASAQVKVKC